MALKMIIDTQAVMDRMALQDIAEVRTSVDSVLTQAHAVLQGMLHTTFEPTVCSDLFYLNDKMFPTPMDGFMVLRLTQGFVQADKPITVNVNATSRKGLTDEPETVSATDYFIDYVRGYLMLDASYLGYWARVGYTAGFDSTHRAPSWLQEAVLAYLPHLIAQPAGSLDVGMMNAANEAQKMAWNVTGKIVEPYLRNRPFAHVSYLT